MWRPDPIRKYAKINSWLKLPVEILSYKRQFCAARLKWGDSRCGLRKRFRDEFKLYTTSGHNCRGFGVWGADGGRTHPGILHNGLHGQLLSLLMGSMQKGEQPQTVLMEASADEVVQEVTRHTAMVFGIA